MKKLIIGLIAVLLIFGAFTAWNQKNLPTQSYGPTMTAQKPAASTGAAASPAPVQEIHTLDYEAIRALYPADTVAIRVRDEELDWDTVAGWLRTNGLQYEDYFRQMAQYYGIAADWAGSVGDGSGRNYAQGLVYETNETLAGFLAIRAFARDHGVTLDEETQATFTPEYIAAEICGEGATVEQLAEKLDRESHMSVDDFIFYSETLAIYTACYQELFGAEGEKLSEEEVIGELEKDGYLSAGHILFMTIDPMTGAALSEEEVAKKKAQAEEIVKELRAIEDPEVLVKRFAELKEQYCEDTGKTAYPEGYTFTPGTMVTEFEEAAKALDDYAVSDPVQSSYGYHVILRLPLSGDSQILSAQGMPASARKTVSQNSFTRQLDAFYEENAPVYAEGLEELDLTKYIK